MKKLKSSHVGAARGDELLCESLLLLTVLYAAGIYMLLFAALIAIGTALGACSLMTSPSPWRHFTECFGPTVCTTAIGVGLAKGGAAAFKAANKIVRRHRSGKLVDNLSSPQDSLLRSASHPDVAARIELLRPAGSAVTHIEELPQACEATPGEHTPAERESVS